jgi:hypothetical protein
LACSVEAVGDVIRGKYLTSDQRLPADERHGGDRVVVDSEVLDEGIQASAEQATLRNLEVDVSERPARCR